MTDQQNFPGNFQELYQAAQRMQQEIGKVQDELAQQTVEGSSGGGMVVATANGCQQLVSLRLEKECVDPQDIAMLQDLIIAAVNQALARAADLAQNEIGKVTGMMNMRINGMF